MTILDPLAVPGAGPAGTPDPGRIGAVVLCGGTAARMQGADKASIELDGVTLLERALAATVTAIEVVVVGEQVPTTRPVTWTVEDPRGGGPAAGLLAGLDAFLRPPGVVLVLAVDMPRVTPGTFARLMGVLEDDPAVDAALLVDHDDRTQPLCGAYRGAALAAARPARTEDRHGLPVHRLLEPLRVAHVRAVADEARDVDTWEDLRELRGRAAREHTSYDEP
ncbi:molybdenum cofactor guanylyltransferase [Nocardioides marmoribigeumensis]|jgi:molybdopterin-guanine dinucleotide biosynthesis protein A|uniref:Molybdopterin-guanine dinucleotide biosynthesis protein A n=1 Tax=Nocardioides marmoribigeumensis TaxID=433649 RepID=A0ABU2BU93_9ACTN|nr:NTP transferase domain-containing protein [Nocardioides marmoribigeumensis]MDR7362199.1 molybdopterin-guanine dinucleotide biosynthesis protein A [Nocardioides marmoribigeumensis]